MLSLCACVLCWTLASSSGIAYGVVAAGTTYGVDEGVIGAASGGTTSSATQSVIGTSGEVATGPTSAPSADARTGYVATLPGVLSISVDAPSVGIGVGPNRSSQSATTTVQVYTDAAGFSLAVEQDHALLHDDLVTTVPAVAGTIAAPDPWAEGTTTGFGFALRGTGVDPKWGAPGALEYAAFPNAPTEIHAGSSAASGIDELEIEYRLAAEPTQLAGSYDSTISLTAVPVV